MSGMRAVTYLIEYESKSGTKIDTDLALQLAKVLLYTFYIKI